MWIGSDISRVRLTSSSVSYPNRANEDIRARIHTAVIGDSLVDRRIIHRILDLHPRSRCVVSHFWPTRRKDKVETIYGCSLNIYRIAHLQIQREE